MAGIARFSSRDNPASEMSLERHRTAIALGSAIVAIATRLTDIRAQASEVVLIGSFEEPISHQPALLSSKGMVSDLHWDIDLGICGPIL